MSGIRVVLHLVRCSQSLLYCDDIDTAHLQFRDVPACEERLAALVAAETDRLPDRPVVMGRCRFLAALPEAPTHQAQQGHPTSAGRR